VASRGKPEHYIDKIRNAARAGALNKPIPVDQKKRLQNYI
jgi:hypothetical protein